MGSTSYRRALVEEYATDHTVYERHSARRAARGLIGLRLDGRGFSSLTSSFVKPFDPRIDRAMEAGVEALMNDNRDARLGFVQSDEITLILRSSSGHFDRRVEKLCSVSAAVVSVAVSAELGQPAHFDCRVLELPGPEDAMAVLAERQQDAERNAVSSTCFWALRHSGLSARAAARRLDPQRGSERRALLAELGIDWDAEPLSLRRGRLARWQVIEKPGYNPITGQTTVATRNRLVWGRDLDDLRVAPTYAELLADERVGAATPAG